MARIVTVFGATGAQGGGLVRAMLADPQQAFTVRAVTRHPASDAGKALTAAGVEVVQADLDDVASLRRAMEGAHGAYAVTNFWEHFSPEREYGQARNLAVAARDTQVAHVIWSTLEDTRRQVPLDDDRMPTLMGRYKVPHFDAKGEANVEFISAGVPTTLLYISFYWDNLIQFGMGPKRGPDGGLVFALPMGEAPLAGIGAEDVGPCALGIFQRGADAIGQEFGIAGAHLTGRDMADAMARVLGEPVRYESPPWDAYRALGFPGAADLGNMFQYYHDFAADLLPRRPLEATRALHPIVMDFDTWLARHRDALVRTVGGGSA
jgi:uncharacterized protein YbjT (DUF2867 family)